MRRRQTALVLGGLLGVIGLAGISARAQILGQGGDAYVFRKKYPASSDYTFTLKRDDETIKGDYTLWVTPEKDDQGNTQLLQYGFHFGQGEKSARFGEQYSAGPLGLDQIDAAAAADYAELDTYFALLAESRLPEGPVKIDAAWALDEKVAGQRESTHTFKGLSKMDDHEVAEMEVGFKSANGEVEIRGTVFLRVSDGTLQHAVYHRRYPDVEAGDNPKIVEKTEQITVNRDEPAN